MLPSDIIKRYRVRDGRGFRLAEIDPTDRCGLDIEKDDAKAMFVAGVKRLATLQERLYAEHRWAILIILQALDAAGKDSVIKHVMSGVNPQGCDVHPFKAPSQIELDHDFLWRASVVLPRRGHIGIFNRSYYEEVLVVRVHKELLERQSLPPKLVTKNIWQERFDDINSFERHLCATASCRSSSSCMSPSRSSRSACSNASMIPPSSGSSTPPMSARASCGINICKPMTT